MSPIHPAQALLSRLWQFSQGRLAAGDGLAVLNLPNSVILGLAQGYAAGFLPVTFVEALATAERDGLLGLDLGGSLVLPAFDGAGAVVDLAAWRPGFYLPSLFSTPRGLLAPRVAIAHAEGLVVVDTVEAMVARLGQDQHGTLLLRGLDDAQANAQSMHKAGVRRITLQVAGDALGFTAAFSAAGIQIETRTSQPILEFVEIDHRQGHAIFRLGDLTVVADIPDGTTRVHLVVRRGGKTHQDDLDLAMERQHQRFAQAAGRTLGIEATQLVQALAGLLPRLEAIADGEDSASASTQVCTAAAAAATPAAADLLADADLVASFINDLDALGWVGDQQAKTLALLTLAGRIQAEPPWLLLRGDRSLTTPAFCALASLVADDHRLVLDRVSAAGLGRSHDLRHKLLLSDDAAELRDETTVALRRLHERGAFAVSAPSRAANGQHRSRLTEVAGPAGLIAAADTHTALDDLAVTVHLDDSPQQVARAVAAARDRHRAGGDPSLRQRHIDRWKALIAALPTGRVEIPFAHRVEFPASRPGHRRELDAFFALVEAHARLHHRQRELHGGAIIASEADFAAVELACRGVLGVRDDALSRRCTLVLAALIAAGRPSYTTAEVQALLPDYAGSTLYDALTTLVARDLLASVPVGHGRRSRIYEVTGAAELGQQTQAIRLAPADEPGQPPLSVLFPGISDVASGNISHVG